ncbi:Rab geranylgeranyltransferase [Mitosporidium daphniae]|uniref:Geranylgeranyl transferase type-2 subunit beta n=1 Tax=Mitosporidium daphniae TaxID=1485682 RepID=A0A098VTG9_9MICR|nr:Rab geranylgeranyltransferase [Mitosporidium daphniae]KGG52358.1 Rab geranylgeranyltransferase [Mitosporidium daphniae]|eukprot:XP_013238794.1 Rab geranylgeranyltransferase [Mitosporidium daphniae]
MAVDDKPTVLNISQHASFIDSYFDDSNDFLRVVEKISMSHIRMNVLYWATGTLSLIARDKLAARKNDVYSYVVSCWQPEIGGFSHVPNGEVSLLATLSAILVSIIIERFEGIFSDQISKASDGSWVGDCFGERDTRFTYAAFSILSLLGYDCVNDTERLKLSVSFVEKCRNNDIDGGFGAVPNAESHSGQVFCCISSLSIAHRYFGISQPRDDLLLRQWLAFRQDVKTGGFNGRPQKLVDVCYSWWVISSLAQLNSLQWIDKAACISFIMSCQDLDKGGFADRPEDAPDVYHTFFAICGLSLLGDSSIRCKINPVYCLPDDLLQRHFLHLKSQ